MNEEDYMKFYQSLIDEYDNIGKAGLAPKCLIPACKQSAFKAPGLKGCPGPQCLNIVSIKDSTIISEKVKIDLKGECTNITRKNTNGGTTPVNVPTPQPNTPGSTPTLITPTTPTPPSIPEKTFFEKYKIIIIIIKYY
jgi:hypothetical protein